MCGIVGYIGYRPASDVILKGLKRTEYRGYDSAGIAQVTDHLDIKKAKGKVAFLEKRVKDQPHSATLGLGHTRWATHGEPNDINAHPHTGGKKKFALVHNGIIENYNVLKTTLAKKGHVFEGQTDTEVLAHLIEEVDSVNPGNFVNAIQMALQQVTGTFGIAIVHEDFPDTLFAARRGSPLLVGVGNGEFFVASDASPIIEYTQNVVYLDDDEMAVVTRSGYEVKTIRNVAISKEVHQLALSLEQIEKGGFPHFML